MKVNMIFFRSSKYDLFYQFHHQVYYELTTCLPLIRKLKIP